MPLNQEALVAKLNASSRSALASAAGIAVARAHYEVDLEHFLLKLTESTDGDLAAIYRHFELDPARILKDLTRALDVARSGNSRYPVLSPRLTRLHSPIGSRMCLTTSAKSNCPHC